MKALSLFLLGLAVLPGSFAAGLKIELPVEKPEFRNGPHQEVAMTNCVLCHSWDYVTMQPPLPRTTWKAVVTKMRATFGAPLTDTQIDEIADYLVHAYGSSEAVGGSATTRPSAQRATGDKDPAK